MKKIIFLMFIVTEVAFALPKKERALKNTFGEKVKVAYGSFINAVIAFLIVAWALFAVVSMLNKLKKKKKEEEKKEEPKGPTETELLMEIRDLLKK